MFTIYTTVFSYIVGNLIFLLVSGLILLMPGTQSFMEKQRMGGVWPVLWGIMAVRCMNNPAPTTQFCCLPCQVPTKWYPLLLATLFQFISFNYWQYATFCSLAAGYLLGWPRLNLQPSDDRLREWETGRFSFLAAKETFITLDRRGATPVWNPFTRGGDNDNNAGGGGSGGRGGGNAFRSMFRSDDFDADAKAAGSRGFTAFGGTGHALGGASGGYRQGRGEGSGRGGSSGYEAVEMQESRQVNDRNSEKRRVLAERLERRLQKQQLEATSNPSTVEQSVAGPLTDPRESMREVNLMSEEKEKQHMPNDDMEIGLIPGPPE
ncbi:hypothetical protein AAMO2058_001138700 [Amorphochlora amoebiformis]